MSEPPVEDTAQPAKTAQQVADQCRVIAHLARAIASVHENKAEIYLRIRMGADFIDCVGRQTAGLMETLGDVLNGMDAADEGEDAWVNAIFHVAQATWPQETASAELTAHVNGIAAGYRAYINEQPGLVSLLYDIDLLPEQLLHVLRVNPLAAGANASRMAAVCELWKRRASAAGAS